jgi:hypothetical protein
MRRGLEISHGHRDVVETGDHRRGVVLFRWRRRRRQRGRRSARETTTTAATTRGFIPRPSHVLGGGHPGAAYSLDQLLSRDAVRGLGDLSTQLRVDLSASQLAWAGILASVVRVLALPLQLVGFIARPVEWLMWIPMLVFELALA